MTIEKYIIVLHLNMKIIELEIQRLYIIVKSIFVFILFTVIFSYTRDSINYLFTF